MKRPLLLLIALSSLGLSSYLRTTGWSQSIAEIDPPSGLPGTPFLIHGEELARAAETTTVTIGSHEALLLSATESAITAVIPHGIASGEHQVTVKRGESQSNAVPLVVPEDASASAGMGIERLTDGQVRLSWSGEVFGATLEMASTLNAGSVWTPLAQAPLEDGGRYFVDLPRDTAERYFRLRVESDTQDSAISLPQVTKTTLLIEADSGGSVRTPDQTVELQIPPGALAEDTEISMTHYVHHPNPESPMLGELILEPAGLQFSQPASFTFHLKRPQGPLEDLSVWNISGANPVVDQVSEQSHFRKLEIEAFSEPEGWARVSISHFSYLSYMWEEPVYLVFEIRGKNLKKGDLIYTLTGREPGDGAFWWPGHAGLYLGATTANALENDGVTIIESTPLAPDFGQNADGVQFSPLTQFQLLSGTHIYMGARRPLFEIDDDDRPAIAEAAISRIGTPYATLGGPFVTDGGVFGGISCVGLTEAAYEETIGSLVPGVLEPVLWPIRQFVYTFPVNEIEAKAGEVTPVFVNGVVKPPKGFSVLNPFAGDYFDNQEFTKVSMTTEPDTSAARVVDTGLAKFNEGLRLFSFKPSEDDVGQTFVFDFAVDASPVGLGEVHKPLFVKVVPGASIYELTETQIEGFNGEFRDRYADGIEYHWGTTTLADGSATVDYSPDPEWEGNKLFDAWNLSFAWSVPKTVTLGEPFSITMKGSGGITADSEFGTHGIWGFFGELGERQPLRLESTETAEHNLATVQPRVAEDVAWVAPVESNAGGMDRTWTLGWWENLKPQSFELKFHFSINESVSDAWERGTITYVYALKNE